MGAGLAGNRGIRISRFGAHMFKEQSDTGLFPSRAAPKIREG